jgi:clan AA aspartic protease
MITGLVVADEARIRLKIRGFQGREQEAEAIIDTGYSGSLTLSPTMVAALALRWRSVERGTLANGSECIFQVYDARVVWDGEERAILVDEADTEPLVGMELLRGHELKMHVRPAGKVTIKRLPSK